jgi:hypothetical protein
MKRERFIAAALIASVLAFYRWTVTSNSTDAQPLFGQPQGDYYKLLTDGFLQGHLYLNLQPDPRLLAAKDPFDPRQRGGAVLPHDSSFYRGHIYINYGVIPVLTLRLPWRLLTRQDLPQNYAVLIFTGLGFLAATGLWLALRRDYFPESGAGVMSAGILVLGLASMTYPLLRRPSLWEEPGASGYCFSMAMLLCLYRALRAPRPTGWLVGAGLFLGCAVGSRPNYIVGVAALAVPLGLEWWRGRCDGSWRWLPDRAWRRQALALIGPYAAVLVGLAGYNFARFGNPLEFGTTYQFTNPFGSVNHLFDLRFVRFNALAYYLTPSQWSRYFPFAKMVHLPPMPPGYSGSEFVHGVLADFPFAWLALLAPLAAARRPAAARRVLATFIGTAAAFFLAVGGLLIGFVGSAGRYMADFTPTLMLLAGIGMLGLERLATGRRRTGVRVMVGAAAAASVFVGVMLSFQVHDLLRQSNPKAYQRLAHFFDTPVSVLERLAGTRYGPLELTLLFPRTPAGTTESLVKTGWEYESDYLLVNYIDDRHLMLGFSHSSYGVVWSQPVEVDYGRPHVLRVQLGSLFPPLGHPYFDRLSAAALADATRGVHFTLDGRPVLDARQYAFDGSPGSVRIGAELGSPGGPVNFSGKILGVKRLAYEPPIAPTGGAPAYGWVEFELSFPGQVVNRGLPLIATGETGRGDLLSIKFMQPGIARFFYDHWGVGLWQSEDVPVTTDVPHRLRIGLPALLLPSGTELAESGLQLELDGQVVWKREVPFYPVQAADVYLGRNGIGASTADQEFPGTIRRIPPPVQTGVPR